MQQTFRKKPYRPISSSIVKKSRTLRPRLIWTSRDSKGGSISFYLKKQNKKIFVKEKRSFIERATYLRSVRFRLRQSFPIFCFPFTHVQSWRTVTKSKRSNKSAAACKHIQVALLSGSGGGGVPAGCVIYPVESTHKVVCVLTTVSEFPLLFHPSWP